ncbi:MAG: hypothetical protein K2W80_01910 [Burkholderiales bacterium]|nr:hypothetical protein [Burkholderiales bacterium]
MSLLDDLKNQAEVLRKRQQSGSALHDHYFREIHERLKGIYQHLNELVNSLNTIRPEVIRYFYIEPSSVLEDLRQADYAISAKRKSIDYVDYFEEVLLRTRCVGTEKLRFEKDAEVLVTRMREFLWSNSLKFDLREYRSERGYVQSGSFTVEPEVPVSISITGVPDRGHILIVTRNLEKLGEVTYTFEIDEVDTPLIEEMAKLLIGKPNHFRSMGKHQQPVRTAARIRPVREELEPEQPMAEPPAEDVAPKSLFGSLKSLLKRKAD